MLDGEISIDDPRAPDVRALLEVHLTFARAQTPPEDAHAMDVEDLLDPGVTFFSYRRGGELLAVGALKRLARDHAEIKSMHTAQTARGRGIGRRMLEHLIAVARAEGKAAVWPTSASDDPTRARGSKPIRRTPWRCAAASSQCASRADDGVPWK